MFPDVSELGREVDVLDCEVVHAGLELCRKHCGGRLWGRCPADGDDLAAQIHFHDNLSLLVGKGLEVSFDNDGLTSFQVFLRSEVGTVQPLPRVDFECLVRSVVREVVGKALVGCIVEVDIRDDSFDVCLAAGSLSCQYLLHGFGHGPCRSLCVQVCRRCL